MQTSTDRVPSKVPQVTLVFWVIIELIVIAALRVFRPSATA